jgi:hypothetical protein
MWITVEKERVFGDISLGISKVWVDASLFLSAFPQRSPQLFKKSLNLIFLSSRKVICNYKNVILFTHLSTAAITTNFKYKFLSYRVLFTPKFLFQGAVK